LIKDSVEGLGECPRCGGIASYIYEIEALSRSISDVEVRVSISCEICGYRDSKKIVIPLRALMIMKYLLIPEARLIAEKIRALTHIKTY